MWSFRCGHTDEWMWMMEKVQQINNKDNNGDGTFLKIMKKGQGGCMLSSEVQTKRSNI